MKPRDKTFELEDTSFIHGGFSGGGSFSILRVSILALGPCHVPFYLTAKHALVHLIRVVRAQKCCD